MKNPYCIESTDKHQVALVETGVWDQVTAFPESLTFVEPQASEGHSMKTTWHLYSSLTFYLDQLIVLRKISE